MSLLLNDNTRTRLQDIKIILDALGASDSLHTAVTNYEPASLNERNRQQRLADDLGDLGARLCSILNEEVHRFLEATE